MNGPENGTGCRERETEEGVSPGKMAQRALGLPFPLAESSNLSLCTCTHVTQRSSGEVTMAVQYLDTLKTKPVTGKSHLSLG